MDEAFREIITQQIAALAPGSRFNLRDLLGNEWPKNAGEARKLGLDFRAQLNEFGGVADDGRDNENLRWYRKQ